MITRDSNDVGRNPRRVRLAGSLMVYTLMVAWSSQLGAQQPTYLRATAQPVQGIPERLTGALVKPGADLLGLHEEYEAHQRTSPGQRFESSKPLMPVGDGWVVIDAVAVVDASSLQSDLEELGLEGGARAGRIVSGRLPIPAIPRLADLESLKFARPAYVITNVGLTTSQGDVAMNSDDVRSEYGVDGSGVTVGVLSDSFNCLGGAAGDVASGDLPPGIVVLLEEPGCMSGTDEGRAMMQIIADVAPGASQYFHTASGGPAGFVQGIFDLAAAGATHVPGRGHCACRRYSRRGRCLLLFGSREQRPECLRERVCTKWIQRQRRF